MMSSPLINPQSFPLEWSVAKHHVIGIVNSYRVHKLHSRLEWYLYLCMKLCFLVMPAKSDSMLTGSWFIVDLNSRSVACWHPLWLHASVGPKLLPCCLSPPCATLTTTAPPCWGSISPSHIWAILLALHHIVHSYESQQLLSRLQSRAMLWNAWLVQKDESARIVICNALVVLCFKSAKDFR